MKTLYEDLLYYLWEKKTLLINDLFTFKGEPIKVLKLGGRNPHSGPDYLNGQVKIGSTTWVGNIEMHINSSDWLRHNHNKDDAYKNVILHVVYNHDKEIEFFDEQNINIPVLELNSLISIDELAMYQNLKESQGWISCHDVIQEIDLSKFEMYKSRLLIERLEDKVNYINPIFDENNGNLEKTFFVLMSRYFGATANMDAFEIFANKVNYGALVKNKSDGFVLASLMFGQAGFLSEPIEDDYHIKLSKEYGYLKAKYKLEEVDPSMWKFGGLMPAGFPTARLSQLIAMYGSMTSLFHLVRDKMSVKELMLALNVSPNEYWYTHFRFGRESKKGVGALSLDMKNRLIINGIIPMKFYYFKKIGDLDGQEHAVSLLEEVKKESNTMIKKWKSLGMNIKSAFDTQALIQLKKKHCDLKKCLTCPIGVQAMNVQI